MRLRERQFITDTVRAGLLVATGALLLIAQPARAQVAAATDASTSDTGTKQDVVVTGSRIASSNTTSQTPITVITSKEIAQSSAQTVEDVLQKIPSIGTGGLYRSTNNGGEGASCTDLRNLGDTRTLVLVDGKRVVHSGIFGVDCVDLDNIPVGLIDRIEVLKDGASSIYGADAVAGVVNIILKKNYVGTQINLGGELSNYGDDRTGNISGTTGFDFANGRGNVALSGSYLDQGPVPQSNRDFATQLQQSNTVGNSSFGSGIPPTGRVFDGPNVANPILPANGLLSLGNGQFRPFNAATDNFNFGQDQFLLGAVRMANVAENAHFDVNDHVTLYLNGFYTHKETETQLSGQPVEGALAGTLPDQFIIPAGNPFNPFGEDVSEFLRTNAFGLRETNTAQDTYQFNGGVRGDLGAGWNYDLFYIYGKSEDTIRNSNEVNFQNLEQEVGFQQTFNPNVPDSSSSGIFNPAVCSAAAGCRLINPFNPSSVATGANFASFTEQAVATFFLRDVGASVTNSHVVQLPYGPLGLAFGVEHRGEQGSYHPDPLVSSGVTLENPQQPTSGGFNVTEVYGEARVPLLADLPWVKDLSADISGRFSDYNTFGSAETWKAGLNYTPVKDIRFRANIGTAFRQPEINELFGGQAVGFNQATDPCAQISSYGALAGIVGANCARQGIKPGFSQIASQVQTIQGGNPALQPETARTYTIGTVIEPRWIPNLSATVDYWHTSIERSIGSLSTQTVLDSCFTSANFNSALCSDVAPRNGLQQLTTVTAIDENLGDLRTNGLDVDMNYLVRLGGGHTVTLANSLTDVFGYTQQNVPNGPFINENGRLLFNSNPQQGFPRIRDNATISYAHDRFSFSWTTRFIDGMILNDGNTDAKPGVNIVTRVNQVWYHDIVTTYAWRKINFIAGIDNLFNRTPPFAPDAATNTDPSVYDLIGRLFYLKTQFRF